MTRRAFGALTASLLALAVFPASADGQTNGLSPTFAGGPVVVDVGPGRDVASGLAVQADGKIVVVGTANASSAAGGNADIVVLRFEADGRLDPSFGAGGQVLIDNGLADKGNAVVVQPDGMIVVVGTVHTPAWAYQAQMAVVRLDQAGRRDPTFNGGGMMVLETNQAINGSTGQAVMVEPDGKIVVAGSAHTDGSDRGEDFLLLRLTPSGTLDGSFGGRGYVRADGGGYRSSEEARFVARRPDGRIVVAGNGPGVILNGNLVRNQVLMQFTPLGALDPTFGAGGISYVNNSVSMSSAVLRPDGTLVTAGHAELDPFSGARGVNVALAGYRADGTLDPRFGSGGVTVTHGPPTQRTDGGSARGNSGAHAIAIDGRQRLVVVGGAQGVMDSDGAVVRYNPAGMLDASLGRAGWIKADVAGESDVFSAVGMLPGGGFVTAGTTRLNSSDDKILLAAYPSPERPSVARASGWNPLGQLGDGTTADRLVPASVAGFTGSSLAGGVLHSLGIDDAGSVSAWGWNGFGQLGNGTTVDRRQPVPVPGLTGASAVAAGYFHSLAVVGGGVKAWGWNPTGQLGDGSTVDRHTPVAVPGLANVVGISAGAYHSLAVRNDGTVWAWGWNGVGQLGDGTTVDRHRPVQVQGLREVVAVAAGAYHSLALTIDGSVWAWGWNAVGQVGDPRLDTRQPIEVMRYGMVALAAGGLHNLALGADGEVWGWGYNAYGGIGDDSTTNRELPVRVRGLGETNALAAGLLHSAAITVDQQVRAWGWNGVGQLGDGTTVDRHTPVSTVGQLAAGAIAAGAHHTLVLSP